MGKKRRSKKAKHKQTSKLPATCAQRMIPVMVLLPGDTVILQGLQNSPQYNGRKGVITQELDRKRFKVSFDDSKSLSIHGRNLAYENAVQLVRHPRKGLTLCATRNFQKGEKVLIDTPTLDFPNVHAKENDKVNTLNKGIIGLSFAFEVKSDPWMISFIESFDIDQASFLKWHQFPEGFSFDDIAEMILEIAISKSHLKGVRFHPKERESDLKSIKQYYMVLNIYAHTLQPENEGPSTALFNLGSRVSHSCNPNVLNRTNDGRLVYYALRDIKKGEELMMNYSLTNIFMGFHDRQELLKREKYFQCICDRCTGPFQELERDLDAIVSNLDELMYQQLSENDPEKWRSRARKILEVFKRLECRVQRYFEVAGINPYMEIDLVSKVYGVIGIIGVCSRLMEVPNAHELWKESKILLRKYVSIATTYSFHPMCTNLLELLSRPEWKAQTSI